MCCVLFRANVSTATHRNAASLDWNSKKNFQNVTPAILFPDRTSVTKTVCSADGPSRFDRLDFGSPIACRVPALRRDSRKTSTVLILETKTKSIRRMSVRGFLPPNIFYGFLRDPINVCRETASRSPGLNVPGPLYAWRITKYRSHSDQPFRRLYENLHSPYWPAGPWKKLVEVICDLLLRRAYCVYKMARARARVVSAINYYNT